MWHKTLQNHINFECHHLGWGLLMLHSLISQLGICFHWFWMISSGIGMGGGGGGTSASFINFSIGGEGTPAQFVNFSILGKFLVLQTTNYFNHIHIWHELQQLSCIYTCEIWMWYSTDNRYFGDSEKNCEFNIGRNWLCNPHPGSPKGN